MNTLTRRSFLGASTLALVGCGATAGNNGLAAKGAAQIEARVKATRDFLASTYPGTQALEQRAAGVLIMPLLTEAGFGFGGGYGRGALQIQGVSVDYYAAAKASFGLQIGAQQYGHALYFMTPEALARFRNSAGWAAGADLRYATPKDGAAIGRDTTEIGAPVEAFVFGQQGLIVGATLSGLKYSRIIP
ncbi:MAG: YSC84-related protein [Cypionkella sp.]|nr:YSC84-related protein [Cypionkella sp.]